MENESIDLKQQISLPTGTFLLLTFATAGFYAYYWMLKHTPLISTAARKPIASETYLLTLIGLMGWGAYVANLEINAGTALLALLAMLAAVVMAVVWSFRSKDALRAYAASAYGIDYQMNSFYTLIFGYLYINYCINEIPEEQARLSAFVQRSANSEPSPN